MQGGIPIQRAYLTVGPQGAGKSTFCHRLVEICPGLILISRDDIYEEVFGKDWHSAYSGAHYVGMDEVWKRVETAATTSEQIILDCWNEDPEERRRYVNRLRSLGAVHVEAWHFVTPKEVCMEWYKAKITAEGWCSLNLIDFNTQICGRNYDVFHSIPISTDQGFDYIRTIDPTKVEPSADFLDL